MVELSNKILGAVNLLVFMLSIPLIGAGIRLATELDTQCVRFLEWPIILIGVIFMVLSLVGFIGACWHILQLLWIYLFLMFFVILLLFAFTIFAFVVTAKGGAHAVFGVNSYLEYHLQDFSPWLQGQVLSNENWHKIRSCIRDANVCRPLNNRYNTLNQLYLNANLSPLQSGCCLPPNACGYRFVNPTRWIDPSYVYTDRDCALWSNDQDKLCYDCDTCKSGLLANLREGWRKVTVVSIVVLIALLMVYIIGCCAIQNARTHNLFDDYPRRYRCY